MTKKQIFLILLVSILSAVSGALACWFYQARTLRGGVTLSVNASLEAIAIEIYTNEIKEAEAQSSNPDRAVALYALNRAVLNLQNRIPPRQIGCRRYAFDLARLDIRRARVYEQLGNKSARNEQLNLAITQYSKMGWQLSGLPELEQALPLIEQNRVSDAMQSFGKIEASCE